MSNFEHIADFAVTASNVSNLTICIGFKFFHMLQLYSNFANCKQYQKQKLQKNLHNVYILHNIMKKHASSASGCQEKFC